MNSDREPKVKFEASETDIEKEKKHTSKVKLRLIIFIFLFPLLICCLVFYLLENSVYQNHDKNISNDKIEKIEKIFLDSTNNSFQIEINSLDDNKELNSIFKRTIEKVGNTFVITVKAVIENQKGFARIKEKLPFKSSVISIKKSGALFKSDGDFVKFIWSDLSDSINEIIVKYQIPLIKDINNEDVIIGEFTSEKLINEGKNFIKIPKTFFNIDDSVSEISNDITINNKKSDKIINKNIFNYHLIAGSFQYENNAKNLFKDLKLKGYDAKYLGKIDDYYKVSFESFQDKDEANKKRKKLINKGISTWIQNYSIEFLK